MLSLTQSDRQTCFHPCIFISCSACRGEDGRPSDEHFKTHLSSYPRSFYSSPLSRSLVFSRCPSVSSSTSACPLLSVFLHFFLTRHHVEGLSNDTGLVWNRDAAECFVFGPVHQQYSCYWFVFLWPFFWHCKALNLTGKKPQIFYFHCLSHHRGWKQSVPVIHLIVVRVNELVSLFRSISVHYSLTRMTRVVLPPFLALSNFLTSLPFFPLSLFPDENAIRGMHLRGWRSNFPLYSFSGGGEESRGRKK